MAFLAPCADKLRDEINARWPNRDKATDGWLGDASHSSRVSDHNPDSTGMVHAIDVDEDGWPAHEVFAWLLEECRAGREQRVWYFIYEGFIYSRTYGFAKRAYEGWNPHLGHFHVSFRYDNVLEADTSPWLDGYGPRPPYVYLPNVIEAFRLERNDEANDVEQIQRRANVWLRDNDYEKYVIEVDGVPGPRTRRAVGVAQARIFDVSFGGPDADGIPGRELLERWGFRVGGV